MTVSNRVPPLRVIAEWTHASFVLIVHRNPDVATELWTHQWHLGDEDEASILESYAREWLAPPNDEGATHTGTTQGWRLAIARIPGDDRALVAARAPRGAWSESDCRLVEFAARLLGTDGIETTDLAEVRLAADLRHAVPHDELMLAYQPEVDLWSRRIVGAEALLRWQHPTRGLLEPGDFLEVAERADLIETLGDWVIDQAIGQLAAWSRQPFGQDLMLRINVSPTQFARGHVVGIVSEALRCHDVDGRLLCVEITENAPLPDFDLLAGTIEQLRALGVSTAIDDWGTGYSRLSQLRRLPVDTVKIDRGFVSHLHTDPRGGAIVRALVGLAQSLDLGVIAEGVETEAEAAALLTYGCSRAQGHLFGHAMSAEELEERLRRAAEDVLG